MKRKCFGVNQILLLEHILGITKTRCSFYYHVTVKEGQGKKRRDFYGRKRIKHHGFTKDFTPEHYFNCINCRNCYGDWFYLHLLPSEP